MEDGSGYVFLTGFSIGLLGGLMLFIFGCDAKPLYVVVDDCAKSGYHDINETKRLKCSVEEKAYAETTVE